MDKESGIDFLMTEAGKGSRTIINIVYGECVWKDGVWVNEKGEALGEDDIYIPYEELNDKN